MFSDLSLGSTAVFMSPVIEYSETHSYLVNSWKHGAESININVIEYMKNTNIRIDSWGQKSSDPRPPYVWQGTRNSSLRIALSFSKTLFVFLSSNSPLA